MYFHVQKNRNAVMIAVQHGKLDFLKEMQSAVSQETLSQAYKQKSKVRKTYSSLHSTHSQYLQYKQS